jgi:hypothetical protein
MDRINTLAIVGLVTVIAARAALDAALAVPGIAADAERPAAW